MKSYDTSKAIGGGGVMKHGSHESLESHAQRERECECDWIQTQATITLFQALGAWRPGRDSEVS